MQSPQHRNPSPFSPGDGVIWYGGDYNPDQWEPGVWQEDIGLLNKLGVNTVTLPVFAWARLQPGPDRFDFGWLDQILELLDANEIGVILATPTASQPAWMSAAYPDVLPLDSLGRRRRHGARNNYCPTSPVYLEHAYNLAEAMGNRYADHRRLRLWHVNNEYGPVCYCERCTDGFRAWLAERYGSTERLNEAWGTATWGHTVYDWSEIDLPSRLNVVELAPPGAVTPSASPSQSLDHVRYASWSLLQCFLSEKRALKAAGPSIPVTTNFHGPEQLIDWHEWAPHVDVVSWNSYPTDGAPASRSGLGHDLARATGRQNRFLLMEGAPGPTNWHPVATLKRPGQVRVESYQALARGSGSVLFFQVRQSRAGREVNHSALIPRSGHLDTRMGAELTALGEELRQIRLPLTAAPKRASVGIIFDWDSWRALQVTSGLDQRVHYFGVVADYHRAFFDRNIPVDLIGPGHDLSKYGLVVAPMLYVAGRQTAQRLGDFVKAGGVLVTTVLSGVADENACVHPGGSSEEWREMLGCWIEETDARPADHLNQIKFEDESVSYPSDSLFDVIRPTSARVRATYLEDFYAGAPAITENHHGHGYAFHVGVMSEGATQRLIGEILDRLKIKAPLDAAAPLEAVEWNSPDSSLLFIINHGRDPAAARLPDRFRDLLADREIDGPIMVEGGGVMVLERAIGGRQ